MEKKPFRIRTVLRRIEEAVKPYPKAALFELALAGFTSPFEQLLACMISIRTRDEVTIPTARRLFARARTPKDLLSLSIAEIDELIRSCSFHAAKAAQMRTIASRLREDGLADPPCDFEFLTSLPGVGPKCANLVLGIACGQQRVSADIHVHRVTNRWGYVDAATPERTSEELESKVPEPLRADVNRLLVPFGKHICTGRLPRCSGCPVLEYCRQVGVEAHR